MTETHVLRPTRGRSVIDKGHKAGWCVHYQKIPGPSGDPVNECAAGVSYDTVFWDTGGASVPFHERPCFLNGIESKPGARPCAHLRIPTVEEVEAADAYNTRSIENFLKVVPAVNEWRIKHDGKIAWEVIDCPACEGRLHLSMSSNGHTHGHCETEDCVSWME